MIDVSKKATTLRRAKTEAILAALSVPAALLGGFVFLNSAVGLASHLLRGGVGPPLVGPLLLTAVIGAIAGTGASIRVLPPLAMQRAPGLALVPVAALRVASLS